MTTRIGESVATEQVNRNKVGPKETIKKKGFLQNVMCAHNTDVLLLPANCDNRGCSLDVASQSQQRKLNHCTKARCWVAVADQCGWRQPSNDQRQNTKCFDQVEGLKP
jgi:hypothetical protein